MKINHLIYKKEIQKKNHFLVFLSKKLGDLHSKKSYIYKIKQ
jgi:hypothetical protein